MRKGECRMNSLGCLYTPGQVIPSDDVQAIDLWFGHVITIPQPIGNVKRQTMVGF